MKNILGGKHMSKAAYFGSFDPFHNGHLDIIKKASKVFDEVFIVIGFNSNKKRKYDHDNMKNVISEVLRTHSLNNCHVDVCFGLAIHYCEEHDISFMIRGLRNNMDYNYEENIALVNKQINPHIETVYFRADKNSISSSVIREFFFYNEDVSSYVPKPVLEHMKRCANVNS